MSSTSILEGSKFLSSARRVTVTRALLGGGSYGTVPHEPALVQPREDNTIDHRTTRQLRGEEGEADGDG